MYPKTAESVKRRTAMPYLCNVFRNTEDRTDRRPCHGKRAATQARQEGGTFPVSFTNTLKTFWIMIKFVLKKNLNKTSAAFNKWYAYPVIEQTMNLRQLAKHMAQHNAGFSEAQCLGVMTAMVACIKEMILDGKNVKIDDLAIFSCGIRNTGGAQTEEEFNVTEHIKTVKFRARATGELSSKQLDLAATLKRAVAVVGLKTDGSASEQSGNA